MGLNKRQYTDGQTIITAANLNEIQDCIIAIEGSYVPKTRTVNSKALSSNITLAASDVGAVPTSCTVNSKALSSNITLSAADVGAVPTSRKVNNKALSADITLTAADVSAVPTTRKVNSKALSSDITLVATDIGYGNSNVGATLGSLNGAINHKLDVYTTTTSSGTGVPTDAEIISSIALNGEAKGEFVARFDLSNGNTAFTIIWTKISANYASGLGFGYYEESGYLLRKYQYSNGTLNTFDIYTSIIALQNGKQNTLTFDSTPTSGSLNPVTSGGVYTALNTPETITLNASTMTFDSGVSFHNASENTITRVGKFCVLTYSIKLTYITSSVAKDIANFFPVGWRPTKIYHAVAETGLGDGKAQPISISYEGYFRTFPVNTGTTYALGSMSYICE